MAWQPIDTVPVEVKRGKTPILGWCNHAADPYFVDNGNLTLYGGHAEGMNHVADGPHVVVWGGGWNDGEDGGWMPDWWFQYGSDFEIAANPTHWQPIEPLEPGS